MIAGVLSVFSRLLQYLADNPYILGVLVLLSVFILALSIFFSGPKPARNPFSVKHVRPVEELVSDQKERDRVLKQSMSNFDIQLIMPSAVQHVLAVIKNY
jgi:hypothetical protein